MSVIGIIPARMGSRRFPGKPLKTILGIPMVGHCYYRTVQALGIENTYVATCDKEIVEYIKTIGGKAIMTSDLHNRASTRTAEALEIINRENNIKPEIVIMVQGDEPLISPDSIESVIPFFNDQSISIVNIASRIYSKDVFEDKNNVKVVSDRNNNALYYSRESIPSPWLGYTNSLPMYMQTGIISFRTKVLTEFNKLDETLLEKIESVDMNRVLEYGMTIKILHIENKTLGVDTPLELNLVEETMRSDPIFQLYK